MRAATAWTVRIENYHPPRLNELLGHWARAARLKKACAQVLAVHCRLAGVPPAEGKRRVRLTITLGPRQRAGDVDAYWKATLDGLKLCGAIKDDSRQRCEIGPVEYRRGKERSTELVLEDIA